jgi:G patch domain-containing protein 1
MEGSIVGTALYEAVQEYGKGPTEFRPTKQVAKIWEQEVVDTEGRRRFHGAFTGGYSAGYYNSVGSAEGWAPKEFKSSRSNRAEVKQAAEDFMDEDDLVAVRATLGR